MFSAFSTYHHAQAFSEFLAYKTRVPVRGAIMLNAQMNSVVLVKGWKKGASWSFPRGKINKDEPDLDCAVREVYEETGYDIKAAGLVGSEEETKYIEVTLREQHMRLYIFRGVPMDTQFEPRTRKEISKIEWYKLSDLPSIRKKKQQNEGKGEDLAINANKFYMVAPFLVPLKKWISAQRKLDKAKQSNGTANNAVAIDEETTHVGDHEAEEAPVPRRSAEDLGRLLDALRQSARPPKGNDRPEASALPVEPDGVTAQLKSVLGVPCTQSTKYLAEGQVVETGTTSGTEDQISSALLTLLRGSSAAQPEQIPQTPFQQVLGNPQPPASPLHPHHQTQRLSSLPPNPTIPFSSTHDQPATVSSADIGQPTMMPQAPVGQRPQPPLVRSIPQPQQPAQLVPRASPLHQKNIPTRVSSGPQVSVPFRTGDPQFAQYAQLAGDKTPSIPSANKLPLPKLTAQSTVLLDLFKGPAKSSRVDGDIKTSEVERSTVPTIPSTNGASMPNIFEGDRSHTVSSATQKGPELFQGPTAMSQALPKAPSLNDDEAQKPNSERHDKLLSLFRRPSVPGVEPVKPAQDSLQPPVGPVELSAIPLTPVHSRGPSGSDTVPQEQAPSKARSGSTKARKRLRQDTSKAHKPSVSATVNGPLNEPQFEILAKASIEAKHAVHQTSHKKSPKKSPITILSWPFNQHAHPQALPSLIDAHAAVPPSEHPKTAVPPKFQTLLSPVRDMPPTPDLKGQPAPLKTFQPQILRRPAHAGDANEPSPIQPLPSPKHSLLTNRTTQPTDHKKSLLSLFTKPSPLISPSPTAPASAIDPSSFISPLSEKPTPREQADAAFAKLARDIGGFPPGFSAPLPLSPSRATSVNAVVAGMTGGEERIKSGAMSPTSRTTPVDRTFLLGYLEGVAKAGR